MFDVRLGSETDIRLKKRAMSALGHMAGRICDVRDAIVTAGGPSTRAAQEATKTIPILGTAGDMVAEGLVASLVRPGGNTSGVSLLAPELDGKADITQTWRLPAKRPHAMDAAMLQR